MQAISTFPITTTATPVPQTTAADDPLALPPEAAVPRTAVAGPSAVVVPSAVVDLSPLAQFLSTLALSRQQIEALLVAVKQQEIQKEQAAAKARASAHAAAVAEEYAATATRAGAAPRTLATNNVKVAPPVGQAAQVATLNDAARHLASAFNDLHSVGNGSVLAQPQFHGLVSGLPQQAATQTNQQTSPSAIGIAPQSAAGASSATPSIDTLALQAAFESQPLATLAQLNETINSFGELSEQYAPRQVSTDQLATGVAAPRDQDIDQSSLAALALQDALQATATESALAFAPYPVAPLTISDLARVALPTGPIAAPVAPAAAAPTAAPPLPSTPSPSTVPARPQSIQPEPAETPAPPLVPAAIQAPAVPTTAATSLPVVGTDQQAALETPPAIPALAALPVLTGVANAVGASSVNAASVQDDDPLATNPELAAALAAYRFNDGSWVTANSRSSYAASAHHDASPRVRPVASASSVAGAGVSGDHARRDRH